VEGGGWSTKVVLVNPTDAGLRGSIRFFHPNGALAGVENYFIAAHGSGGDS
jgi:hypothetical protein